MQGKIVKPILQFTLRALIMLALSMLLLQFSVSHSHALVGIVSLIREHRAMSILLKFSLFIAFFFSFPYLLKQSNNNYAPKQYTRMLSFRWVALVAFLVFESLQGWG